MGVRNVLWAEDRALVGVLGLPCALHELDEDFAKGHAPHGLLFVHSRGPMAVCELRGAAGDEGRVRA